MMLSIPQSATPNPVLRTPRQPSFAMPARTKKVEIPSRRAQPAAPGPSTSSRTTLSQRFRRAIQQGDLAAAQRIATRAFDLQFLPQSEDQDDAYGALGEGSTSRAPRAALRAAQAQRPSSAHPFDIRNVADAPERVGLAKHHHHRKYTLAVHDESLAQHAIDDADPSLLVAIRHNADVEMIRWLIEMGHEQQTPSLDTDGNTVLHLATLYDRSDIIYAYSTYTSSHVASTLGDLIDAETLHDRRTALHLSCIRGFDDVARQLLDLGADVDLQDRAGNTALHFASAWGHVSLLQLLIERGCSLAVKNAEGSTASDYAYSHSVKEALETLGRVRYESRKKTRRGPVATVMPAGGRPSASFASATSPLADESMASDRQSRSRPFPSFLSRNGSNSGAHRGSTTTTPVRGTFPDTTADQTTDLYDDWDPEKTFAQPGQDLFPGNRGVFSSPPVQRIASPANLSTPGRASIDLYSEVLNHSPHAPAAATLGAAPHSAAHEHAALAQNRVPAQSPSTTLPNAHKGLAPNSISGAEIKRQLSPNFSHIIRRTPSPQNVGASADKVRLQDAAAMSLFRSTTPQPNHVPGRIDTPPIPYTIRSESPLLLNRAGKGGVKSPPPPLEVSRPGGTPDPTAESGSSGKLNEDRIGEGPPLLAPVATLPRLAQGDVGKVEGSGAVDLSKGSDARSARGVHDQVPEASEGARRDPSPSTPRPADDRETF
ncbi:Indoleamine 2,3-dioxygenase [Pseudozyma hubeiensis]|nr:Indoleamine 2,3-dioxygenase [Pseudozyma hubeiensis]